MPTLYRQIRIFVLPTEPERTWYETVVGRIIKPAITEHPPDWFWFTRYGEGPSGSSGDTDLSVIPPECATGTGDSRFYRSVRFRVAIGDQRLGAIEEHVLRLVAANGYAVSSFVDYPWIDDLAQERFVAPPRTPARRQMRAELIAQFLGATSNLYLDALTGPDAQGQYRLEVNDVYQHWALGSTLEPVRHLFVNLTGAPTQVVVQNGVVSHSLGEPQLIVQRTPQGDHIIGVANYHPPSP